MKLKSQLLLYLDKTFFLDEIKHRCIDYLQELTENVVIKFPPFRFLMELDVLLLFDSDPELGNWLLKEPIKFQRTCSEILYACLQTLNTDNKVIMSTQVAVNLRLKCVPRLLVRPNIPHLTGLTSFYGLLLSVSKPESYGYHTVWSCPEECEGNEVIVQYIPKVPPKCYICKSVLFENSGLRRCGEKVYATFEMSDRLLSKTLVITDDLIPKLKLGSNYNIYVVTVKNTLVVWSVEEVVHLSAPITSPVPADIQELFVACKGIPWQFIYCLASSIGIDICPLHCYMHLKICLMLSLTSVAANNQTGSSIIHVLAAGHDTGYVGLLMEKAAELSNRRVYFGTSNTTTSLALIGSSGGVCVLPLPFSVYKQKHISELLSTLETGEIITETGRVKLQGAVWAQGMDLKKMAILNIASVFGTVCRGDYGEYNEEIVDFILERAVEPVETSKDEVRALKDVAKYIELVSGINVTLDVRTEKLLSNYFLTARRERPRGVTVGSMNSLVAICLTSAGLCRRTVANVNDAVFAIWLHVCGSPEPRPAPDEYLQTPADIKKLQKMMVSFKDWLQEFIGYDFE